MTLPQDDRSPHRQQRWLDCKNVGSQSIPAYGVVQIDDTERVESVRTVLNVKRPTTDGHCNVMINGPLAIAENGSGVCTNDFPAYALYSGSPAVSEVWGSTANSFMLKKNARGFIILGDEDGTIVRIQRDFSEFLFAEALLGMDLCGQTSQISVTDAKLLPRCISFTPSTITNLRKHRGKNGFRVLLIKRACGSQDPCGGDETWDIFDVEMRPYCAVIGVEHRASCLVLAGLQLSGEWCPSDQPIKACPVVLYIDCIADLPPCDLLWLFDPTYVCCGQGSGSGTGAPAQPTGVNPGRFSPWRFPKRFP